MSEESRIATDDELMRRNASMREALEDDMGKPRLPDAVRDAIYWLEAGGRKSVADGLDSWARQNVGTSAQVATSALDAIAEVIGYPKEAWRIAGCDALAHAIADLQRNYIALRDTQSATLLKGAGGEHFTLDAEDWPQRIEPAAYIEHHKGGDNLTWEPVDHPYAKATPLYKAPVSATPRIEKAIGIAHYLKGYGKGIEDQKVVECALDIIEALRSSDRTVKP